MLTNGKGVTNVIWSQSRNYHLSGFISPKPHLSASSYIKSNKPCIAIRRETINAWERRAPLAPKHVRWLVKNGVDVLVQPSNRRAYSIQEYIAAGAIAQEDLSPASVIMSVKTVPIDDLLPNKTYCFFSHTIKAQSENMPLLDAIMQKNIRLIDYEKMVNETGTRLVAFGKWAGFAGIINIFHGLGLRLLALGHHTPFIHIGLAQNYRDSHMARNAIRDAGYDIALGMMPRSLGPLTFVFTGSGNVAQGAQELFQELPFEYVEPKNLHSVSKYGNLSKVYGCSVSRQDHLVRKAGGPFDPDEYQEFPDRYFSTFAKEIAPFTSVLVNGIYWGPNSPRLLTIPDAKILLTPTPQANPVPGCPTLKHRMLAICDISADPGGSIEFATTCTTIDKPFCMYDADQNVSTDSVQTVAVSTTKRVSSCATLTTCQLRCRWKQPTFSGISSTPLCLTCSDLTPPDLSTIMKRAMLSRTYLQAVIATNGNLTPNFEYITYLRKEQVRSAHKTGMADMASDAPRALILGAGFVSAPAIEYLTRNGDVRVTVATALRSDIERLFAMSSNVEPVLMDVEHRPEDLEKLIKDHDVVVSLLPYSLHPTIAKMCIRNKTNMVTASYYTPAMEELRQGAEDAGIAILQEVGLDPGIDHFLAMDCFSMVQEHGGKVTSFVSYCGGLPAPECSENPLRYKFSWSPRGVLLNLLAGAKFLKDGQVVNVEPGGPILDVVEPVEAMPGFALEGFPNRDSTVYTQRYNIPSAQTCLRGTLRYKGFSDAGRALVRLGLVSEKPLPDLDPLSHGPDVTWKELLCILMNQKTDVFAESLKSIVQERLGDDRQFHAIEGLGLFSEETVVARVHSPINALTAYLEKRLAYEQHERDVCIMRHDVTVEWPDRTKEVHHVDFVAYGDVGGNSAMAKTVGLTTAIATKMLLQGEIQRKGMLLPLKPDIYRPILQRLKSEGLTARSHFSHVRD